jgi:amino acid transporter
MGKRLERDLGLASVLAISVGAMVGSGIFILPALAVGLVGPGVVLAYVIAGVLVLPAALSQSELATAMPKAGGSYLYIERGMGPLAGTVAGLGSWFSLVFKSGLALVGGVPYLVALVEFPPELLTPLALALGAVLTLVNLVGAKQTGTLQVGIVAAMLLALGWFVLGGGGQVETARFADPVPGGAGGLLAATGLVVVSYAGVLKVASVAEEVERPDRNIPLGIIGSLVFTTLLYALIVFVLVGVVPVEELSGSLTPVADAADRTLGTAGVVAVVAAAILALVSTANAGVLSASRYPFAMARDRLVPARFGSVSERFRTPSTAITATGVAVLLLVAFVPILEIAKLASAFGILVFVMVNVAVVVFRESDVEYEPTFHSPLYPWTQVAGVVGGLVVLAGMGPIPLVGAASIVAASGLWYLVYVRRRVDREGALVTGLRGRLRDRAVTATTRLVAGRDDYEVLVGVDAKTSPDREATLVGAAADLARPHDGRVVVVKFEEVPDQLPLGYATETKSPADAEFEETTAGLAADVDVPVVVGEVVSHDTEHALANYARHRDVDALVLAHPDLGPPVARPGWVARRATCDVVCVADESYGRTLDGVTVLAARGPADPAAVGVGDAVARANDVTLTLAYPGPVDDRTKADLDAYHRELAEVCGAPVRTGFARTDGGGPRPDAGGSDELVVAAAPSSGRRPPADVGGGAAAGVVVYPHPSGEGRARWRLLERLLY